VQSPLITFEAGIRLGKTDVSDRFISDSGTNSESGLQSLILLLINADDSATLSSYLIMGFHGAHGGKVRWRYGSPSSDYLPDGTSQGISTEANCSGHMGVQGEVGD
jgi:hypothetical protein